MKLLKKYLPLILLCLVCCLCLSLLTEKISYASDKETNYIIDEADIFTDEEDSKLNKLATKYSNKWDYSIIVLTTDDTQGKTSTTFASDYYDNFIHDSNDYQNNSIVFLVDMENRECFIFAYEDAQERMNHKRSDKLLDSITPYLSDGDYYKATKTCLNKINDYLKVKPGVDPDNIFLKTWFQLLIAIIIGAIAVGIMVGNSGGRVTTNASTYLDQGNSSLTGHFDNYIRTTTSRVKKPSNNNSGGGTGHTSGGSSFSSSGGHKF